MDFERHRARLTVLAYQMLGSVQAAEDVVQEAWLRLERTEPKPESPGWLRTVVSRLCLDELKSARVRRETYPGPFLPEPWEDGRCDLDLERSHDLSLALLTVLDALSPRQRVAFVLREALDVDTPVLADTLGTSEAGVRQLLRRARTRVATAGPTTDADPERQSAVLMRYAGALSTGDVAALTRLLTNDAILLSDGGGVVRAAKVPVRGAPKIARALTRFAQQYPPGLDLFPFTCNQRLAVAVLLDGFVLSVTWLGVVDGQVARIWSVLEPHKLRPLARAHGWKTLRSDGPAPVGVERLLGRRPTR